MARMTYRTIIVKDGKGYMGYVPALEGCLSDGKTVGEVRKNLKEAMKLWIEVRIEKGWEVPEDGTMEALESVEIDNYNKAGTQKFCYA